MSTIMLAVPGITCGGCVRRVTNALQGQPGINSAEVKVGSATVEFDPALTSVDQIKQVMQSAGYPVAAVTE